MDITPEGFCSKFEAICHKKEDAGTLLKTMQQRTYKKGEILLKQDQASSTLYLVWSGSLSVSLHQQDITIELGDILPGGWFGELGFIEPGPATATVTTNEETSLLSLDQDGLHDLLEKNPDIVTQLLHTLSLNLAKRLRETKQHVFKQIAEDDFMLTKDAESDKSDKWYKHFGHKLMGISGER
jgi:CRP-like cAMP-binding protein